MKLKTVKIILYAIFVLVGVCIVLCAVTKLDVFAYIGITAALGAVVFWAIFGRCPSCGKFIRKAGFKICPSCGKKLDWK